MESAKETYCVNLCNRFKNDPKALYSRLSLLTLPSCIPSSVHLGSINATTDYDKANLFNSYFNSTFVKSNFNLPPVNSLPAPSSQLFHIDFSASDVFKKQSQLNIYKSGGVDKIHPLLLKLCAGSLLVPIPFFKPVLCIMPYLGNAVFVPYQRKEIYLRSVIIDHCYALCLRFLNLLFLTRLFPTYGLSSQFANLAS